jgi:hypothetical protein
MSPPTSFILPCRLYNILDLDKTSIPLLITSNTASELVTFAVTYAQSSSPAKGRHVLITSQGRDTLTSTLTSSLLTHASSFLHSTLSIIAADTITVYYVDTLAQLRVLLSTLQHSKIDFFGVDSFLHLHEPAEEFSAQGLSCTLAAMVQIASSSNGVLVLREPHAAIERVVPILNAGVGSNTASLATTPVLRILGRWVRGFWNQETDGEGEGSAEWVCLGAKWKVRWTLLDGVVADVQMSPVE